MPTEAELTQDNSIEVVRTKHSRLVTVPLMGMFILSIGAVLYFAKALFLPIVLAFLLALTCSPIVRFASRWHIPAPATALILVACLLVLGLSGLYGLSSSFASWIDEIPNAERTLQRHWNAVREPLEQAMKATDQIEAATGQESSDVQRVVIQRPPLLESAATDAFSAFTTVAVTTVLTFFLLASGPLFYNKLVRVMPTLTDKKRALTIVYSIEKELSNYLMTVSFINVMLGTCIGLALWALDVPNPVLWGVMAALLNFIPYAGALIGAAIVTAVALLSSDQLVSAGIAGAVYLGFSILEGNFVTPWLVGKRLALNTVVVFIGVGIWAWLWGPIGAIIAVPLLSGFQVTISQVPSLEGIAEFLGD